MLKMEVVIPARIMDFDFNSVRSSPCSSIPSTPTRFGDYSSLSAPTSPTRISAFYREFDNFLINDSRSGGVPFDREEMPKSPKKNVVAAADDDFAFDFSEELEKTSLTAEELFDGGVIRPLKPPPRLQFWNRVDDSSKSTLLSPRSPRSPKEMIRNVFSPRRKKVSEPSAAAAGDTRKQVENERGRDRVAGLPKNSSPRGARSLSPYRVSESPWEEEEKQKPAPPPPQQQQILAKQSQVNSESINVTSSKSSSRRWKMKDFLLFRSASEGRASDRDPLRKYSGLSWKPEDVKGSSFRSADGSGSGSWSKRGGTVSAHELHYTKNKAAADSLKRRTFLPYKTGILGVLGFS